MSSVSKCPLLIRRQSYRTRGLPYSIMVTHYSYNNSISKWGHTLKYWELWFLHMNFGAGDTIQLIIPMKNNHYPRLSLPLSIKAWFPHRTCFCIEVFKAGCLVGFKKSWYSGCIINQSTYGHERWNQAPVCLKASQDVQLRLMAASFE